MENNPTKEKFESCISLLKEENVENLLKIDEDHLQ